MTLKDYLQGIFRTPHAAAKKNSLPPVKQGDIIIKLEQEFKDRSRKDINKWRDALETAEAPDNPRWVDMQDIIDELLLDAHLASVIDLRKSATLNNRFYVVNKTDYSQDDELSALLNHSWFYQFIEYTLDAIFRKVSLLELTYNGENIHIEQIPFRNVCPQFKRVYLEVYGDKFIDYTKMPAVIEVLHNSPFGLINDVIPNVIWKRNALQSYAEFTERFGMPLISATVSNIQDAKKAEESLKAMGENATAVFPQGADIQVHSLANAGNPESTYIASASFHDQQVSKRIVGSTTLTDQGANRAQTQVHLDMLDFKIALADKRMIAFVVNDRLFPVLQSFGLPFDNTKSEFKFDDTEDLSLNQQWEITRDALLHYEMDIDEIKKTFNLPLIGTKQNTAGEEGGISKNFR
jgi:phage gp29-like protein